MGSWEYKIGDDKMAWSEGMYQLFDLKKGAKVKPETYLNYIVKEEKAQAKAFVNALLAGAETIDEILTIETKNGVRKILKIKGILVKDTDGKPVRMLGVDLDITELTRSEEALKALNRSLDQRNKELEAKNEELANFSFIASHDLREPLRKIHTFSDWLLQRENENLSQTGQDYLRRMRQSVLRMDHLIEDVLVLTKLHAAAFEEDAVDLNTVLKSVKAELAESIRMTKTTITADNLPQLTGNKSQLHHLFKHLATNAIKFQKPGTAPQLTIKSSTATAAEIVEHGLNIESRYLKICFTDNGIGIEKSTTLKYSRSFNGCMAARNTTARASGLRSVKR